MKVINISNPLFLLNIESKVVSITKVKEGNDFFFLFLSGFPII